MIMRSATLMRRLVRETVRACGSEAVLVFYTGEMPGSCDYTVNGERLHSEPAGEERVRQLAGGSGLALPDGAKCWRLYDNGGLCMMQGDDT